MGGNAAPSDEYTPTVIAPRADGSALLAWTDRSTAAIRMAALTADDTLDRALPGLAGLEVHAMLASNGGAALAVVSDDPDIGSTTYCRSTAKPDNAVCGKMDLVRVDAEGRTLTRTTLTKKTPVGAVGAQFIWWYGHTARLATDGAQIGVYYRSAMSTARPGVPGEIDIHAGDTLQFVDGATGALRTGGWGWGCSHSWSVRLAHDGAQWAAACHGDAYPNAMQVSRLATPTAAPDAVRWLADTDPTQRALGGLVPAASGHWLSYIETVSGQRVLKLAKVPRSGSALTTPSTVTAATAIDGSYPFRPYMAALGADRLLLAWKSGGRLVLGVADATTGAWREGPVTTTLAIDTFSDLATTPSGDVVWANTAGGNTVSVNRVASCRLSPT